MTVTIVVIRHRVRFTEVQIHKLIKVRLSAESSFPTIVVQITSKSESGRIKSSKSHAERSREYECSTKRKVTNWFTLLPGGSCKSDISYHHPFLFKTILYLFQNVLVRCPRFFCYWDAVPGKNPRDVNLPCKLLFSL